MKNRHEPNDDTAVVCACEQTGRIPALPEDEWEEENYPSVSPVPPSPHTKEASPHAGSGHRP